MEHVNPNIEWYLNISHEKHVYPRCPFVSIYRCPRFYQSLALLGDFGGHTKIKPKEDRKLLKQWKKSDLWPSTEEQATQLRGEPGKPAHYWNFCPEVTFEESGLFAVHLYRYADEIDMDVAQSKLTEMQAPISDWRWEWASITPIHYTECPLYSPLDLDVSRKSSQSAEQDMPGNALQAFFHTVWNWNPFWRKVAIAIFIFLFIVFTIWLTLPDQTKEQLLNMVFH